MFKKNCDCIIPFYNEGERLNDVLKVLTNAKFIKQIVCVDDGSNLSSVTSNEVRNLAKRNYKLIQIRLRNNQGKAQAVSEGLKLAKSDYIFLCDADIRNLKTKEIEVAIENITENPSIDMIIFKRIHASFEAKWQRANTIFSGERILKRKDLIEIFKTNPKRYQLEIAINKYMMDMKKRIYWMPSSAVNVFKKEKLRSWFKGTIQEQQMHLSMIKYAGLLNYLKQVFFFCRNKLN